MLPNWNAEGFLDPFVECGPIGEPQRFSPHVTTMTDVVDVLGINRPRLQLLEGLLRFRKVIREIGLDQGFQWINGSFVENVEDLRECHPRDIDVVTFYILPDGMDQEKLASFVPSHKSIKESYRVDAYFLQLNSPHDESFIDRVCYWYALWSHNRDRKWKGFVQVGLTADDQQAEDMIRHRMGELGDVA